MVKKQKKTQKEKVYSLKYLLENKKTIKREHIKALRKNLMAEVDMPTVEGANFIKSKIGETISLQINNYPLPILNLYEGCVQYNNFEENFNTINVSFNSDNGIVFSKGKFNKETNMINLSIPKKARSGVMRIYYPLREIWGPYEDKSVKENKIFSRTSEECESPPEGVLKSGKTIVVIKVIAVFVEISCTKCKNDPICIGWLVSSGEVDNEGNPIMIEERAIKFDENDDCYVDQLFCKGQMHVPYQEDSICWECFSDNDAIFSDKCEFGFLTKTLHISGGYCCGCCHPGFLEIEGVCLKQLCGENAILGGSELCDRCPGQIPGDQTAYYVDPERCIACYICFDNVNCVKPKMKAYIKPKTIAKIVVILHDITVIHILPEIPDFSELIPNIPPLPYYNLYLGIWGKKNKKPFFEEYPIQFKSNNSFKLNKELELEGDFHLGLYYKKDQARVSVDILGFANVQSSVKHIKPITGIHLNNVIFNSKLANLQLKYTTKRDI